LAQRRRDAGGSGYGIIGDIIVGLFGAFIGNWLRRGMNVSPPFGTPLLNRMARWC
jgi:uncharacterized membrane protein YeaQ/YmgE (transglycosylase-associated protein family)